MNYKSKYTLSGAGIGAAVAACLWILQCACAFISCSNVDGGVTAIIFVVCILIGALIGFFVGISADKEELRQLQAKMERERQESLARAEQERQEALERAERERQNTLYRAKELLHNIAESRYIKEDEKFETRKMDSNYNFHTVWTFEGGYDSIYKEVWSIKSEITSFGSSYSVQFNNLIQEHIKSLNDAIKNDLEKLVNVKCSSPCFNLEYILHKLMLLKYANGNDCKYDSAIHTLKKFIKLLEKPMYFLKSNAYGNFTLPLDDPKEMSFLDEKAHIIKENLVNLLQNVINNSDSHYSNISICMSENFLNLSGKLMWYYAKKQPFDVSKFRTACSIYERFTIGDRTFVSGYDIDDDDRYYSKPETVKLEELLAIIYNKLTIGGSTLAQQEKKRIDDWIKDYHHKDKDVEILASALAWMELYDLELDVLRAMVERNIQMTPEVQERLKFLESGGTSSNVKVYEVEPESHFTYDSSSENWNANEFNVFFRKVGMKKLKINYSLAISSWKKTLPLSSGQNVSMDDIYCEFQKITKDFGGEVSCIRTKAKAVDLDNVSYPDAVVFKFTSERNKCLSMLFSCEKFGRNLNLTIITLFTPDNDMDVENMQKYATAIKSNIYVDSFRETILQAVDEVIKEERNIYDDESNSSSVKKIVE